MIATGLETLFTKEMPTNPSSQITCRPRVLLIVDKAPEKSLLIPAVGVCGGGPSTPSSSPKDPNQIGRCAPGFSGEDRLKLVPATPVEGQVEIPHLQILLLQPT